MENDIEPCFGEFTNISKIGKYGKFIDFSKKEPFIPFEFTHDALEAEKRLSESDMFLAMENMKDNLDKFVAAELQKNHKLQNKIKEIQEKANKRIEKLKMEPISEAKKKCHYHLIEKYFTPDLSEGSLVFSDSKDLDP